MHYAQQPGQVLRVYLAQPKKPFKYKAGQYVELLVNQEYPKPFSIANAFDAKIIEFHIKINVKNKNVINQIKKNKTLSFRGPYGKMIYHSKPHYPVIFITAGTGFAPCKAIIEELSRQKKPPLYYSYVVTRQSVDKIYKKILKNHPDLSRYHIYSAGPREMVLDAQKKLGFPTYFYSDWLGYKN